MGSIAEFESIPSMYLWSVYVWHQSKVEESSKQGVHREVSHGSEWCFLSSTNSNLVIKAHSLFIQEEMQRSVTNPVRVESTVLATKSSGNNFKGKERPICTHCGKMGHTVDKCYKLHGFPPRFKFKNKKNAIAHQVSPNIEPNQGNQSNGVFDFASILHTSQTHD